MFISQKCQYALRAVFELAKRSDQEPVKIALIAEAQAIPPRFLEVILSQLKQGKFVTSRRGKKGGYVLAQPPDQLTVGEIIRFIQGPVGPVDCAVIGSKTKCPFYGNCAFLPMWKQVHNAISNVYDNTTLQDLLDQEEKKDAKHVPCYSI